MKCKIFIDKAHEEEVLIYTHELTQTVKNIENFVNSTSSEIIGYQDKAIFRISPLKITCVYIEGNKIFALCNKEKYELKERLYVIEERLGGNFLKINQSCIVNVSEIERFDASISGALNVVMKNGFKDYVSRRQLKQVKVRLGLKNEKIR